jgi:hypothetical protein
MPRQRNERTGAARHCILRCNINDNRYIAAADFLDHTVHGINAAAWRIQLNNNQVSLAGLAILIPRAR